MSFITDVLHARCSTSLQLLPVLTIGLALAVTPFGAAHATPASHKRPASRDGQAYVPVFNGPAVPQWVYTTMLSRHCTTGYPMTESMNCGTVTGGPAGGIN
jgi:hypothetical protein